MKKAAMITLAAVVFAAASLSVSGQKGVDTGTQFGHGEDSTRCLRNTSLYSTYYDNKDYNMASQFWRPVFNECPASSKNIYIRGEYMYKDFYRKSGNKAYIDTVLMILDQRTKYYGEGAQNDLRKAIALYELGGNDTAYAHQAHLLIKKVIRESPQSIDHTFSTLSVAVAAKCYSLKVIDATEVVNAYSSAMGIVSPALSRRPDDAKYLDARKNIDAVFKSSGAASCENLERLFTASVEQNQSDTALLRKVIGLLKDSGCKDSELYYKASTYLYKSDRSASAALTLAEMNMARKNYSEAVKYYTEAAELETNGPARSVSLTKIATIELTNGNKQAARDAARKAWSLDNTNGNALYIIAESYAGAKVGDEFENQAVYWVVVDYLVKARNTDPQLKAQADERIALYSKLFPTKEEAFFRSYVTEGASYQVGGWVNESTTIRFRKE